MSGGDGFLDHPHGVFPKGNRAFGDMGVPGDDAIARDAVPAPGGPFGAAVQQHRLLIRTVCRKISFKRSTSTMKRIGRARRFAEDSMAQVFSKASGGSNQIPTMPNTERHKFLPFRPELTKIHRPVLECNPMGLLIRNARVLTLAGETRPRRGAALRELGVVDRGDVLVGGDRIEAVGPKLEAPEGTDVVDANGRVLMPGFIDCHTRLCWAGDRLGEWEQGLRGVSRREILQAGGGAPAIMRAVRDETRKQLAAGLKPRLDAVLREGTTTVEIKSGYGLATDEELKMLHAIVRASNDWPGTVVPTALLGASFAGIPDDYARMVVKEMLPEVAREFPEIAVDAICDRDAWSVDACVRLFEKARKHHPIRVHADRFVSLGMVPEAIRLGARSIDQLEASSKADLLLLAQSPACGVILPCTGFETNQRYARAGFLADAGGAVALATGCGPESAPGHSMPFAIALAVRFCGLTPAEAIAASTVNGAAVLNLRDRGTIEPGQRADLILLRHRDERLLAWEIGGNPVDLVICGGRSFQPGWKL